MTFEFGFTLANGTRIVHGEGSLIKPAYSPELGLPGILQVLSPGHGSDSCCVSFSGPNGLFQFDTTCRMPRHVHMSPRADGPGLRYVVEKLIILNGIAVAEIEGEIYVIPPGCMVTIAHGVPHAWVAASEGLDLQALGVADESLVSDGRFLAVYEYEEPTGFYPTAQTKTLVNEEEYVQCDDLHSIRIADMDVEYLKKNAWFVWGRSCRKL